MLYRNRFTKESIGVYERNFEKQLKKLSEKKIKSLKLVEDINRSN